MFKNKIDIRDLMGLPPKDKEVQTEEEAKGEEAKGEEECSELEGVINSEVEDEVDAGSNSQDSLQNGAGTDSYEENKLDKQLNINNEERARQGQEEEKEAEMAETQNEDLKQKVVEVLKKFKGETQVIEQLRETNPQAYMATLDLVNVMLKLARQLGLAGGEDEDSPVEEELENQQEENGMEKSMILPDKQTTRHIPKPRRLVGSIDSKGRQKVIDKEGDINWVDRKKGVVRDESGKVVKVD